MNSTSKVNPVLSVSAALAIAAYFFWFTGGGLHSGFTPDDLMNLWRSWQDPLPHILKENFFFFLYPKDYRPMGTLFYHIFYNAFGLDPLPYRICMLAFLLANVGLVYAFARRISQSREIAAVTALLHAYHVGFEALYKNTGTCYDIFCCFFYLSALILYLRIRQEDRLPRPTEYIGILSLMICALDAKEMAVTLPVMIGIYEMLYHPPPAYAPRVLISWLRREGGVACWGALIDLIFIVGKIFWVHGIGRIGGAYQLHMSLGVLMQGLRHDLDEVFTTWGSQLLREPNLAILLLLIFLFAWRSGLAHFRFGLLFWLVGILPVAFVPSRSIYAIYLPLAGFDLCAATLLISTRDWVWRGVRRLLPLPSLPELRQILTFVAVLLALASFYYVRGAMLDTWIDEQSREIDSIIEQLRVQLPTPKKGAHMLFIKDPFIKTYGQQWATVFVTHLLYRDSTIEPDRLWQMREAPDAEKMKQYDYVFSLNGTRLVILSSR